MKARTLIHDVAPLAYRKQALPAGSVIFSKNDWREIARLLNLSKRQLEMVRAVFDDQTEFAIATSLGISQHTVHTHFERLHRKLAVTNRVQLVLRIMAELPVPAGGNRISPSLTDPSLAAYL
jgi:DNA-binding CsgD family transcriptional regulator